MSSPPFSRFLKIVLLLTALMTGVVDGASDASLELDGVLREHLLSLRPMVDTGLSEADLTDHVVVVSFFASWSPPCRVEFENLNALVRKFESKPLTVVAINVFEAFDDNDGPRLAKFLADSRPEFVVVEGTQSTIVNFGDVNRIPTVYIFSRNGSQAMQFIHHRGAKKMHATVEEMSVAVERALRR